MPRKKKVESEEIGDDNTNKLMNEGVYRLEAKGKKRIRIKRYSFWSSMKVISLLAFLLWWLPTIGQMIAGYVGGRRAPSPWKAVIAALIPVSVIFCIIYAYDNGILSAQISALYSLPSSVASGLASTVPFTAPYLTFVGTYMTGLIDFLNSTIALWLNGILITILFAYIGGLAAERERNELDFRKRFSMLLPQSLKKNHHAAYTSVSPRNWYDRNDHRLDNLTRVTGTGHAEDGDRVVKVKGKARAAKVNAKKAEEEEDEVEEEPIGEPRYTKKALNQRLVARAMSHYDKPKKRRAKHKA
jgi:hypothetical protein